jgi:hypothetical protein
MSNVEENSIRVNSSLVIFMVYGSLGKGNYPICISYCLLLTNHYRILIINASTTSSTLLFCQGLNPLPIITPLRGSSPDSITRIISMAFYSPHTTHSSHFSFFFSLFSFLFSFFTLHSSLFTFHFPLQPIIPLHLPCLRQDVELQGPLQV